MKSSLERCPDHIVECIVDLLGLADICSLRLTCLSLATKSSHYRFRKFFRSKHVNLDVDSLQEFARAVKEGGLPCLVRDLYIVGVAANGRGTKRSQGIKMEQEIGLLSQAFTELAKFVRDGTLPALTLRLRSADLDKPRSNFAMKPRRLTRSVWQCTTRVFEVALRALSASKLRVRSLNVFNDADQKRCSLACDQFNKIDWSEPGLAESLAGLETLSISISSRVLQFDDDKVMWITPQWRKDQLSAEATEESNFIGLANLISLCPRLQDFHLHYFYAYTGISISPDAEQTWRGKLIRRVVEMDSLPNLERCTLRGVHTCEDDLLDLLKRMKPRELSLQSVCLLSGEFRSILDHCTSKENGMTRLHFDTLFERQMIRFHGVPTGSELFPGLQAPEPMLVQESEMLLREGPSVTQPIVYDVTFPRMVSTPHLVKWRSRQREEYG